MFNRKNKSTIDSLIGSSTSIEGDIHFRGGLRIDGHVKGNVIAAELTVTLLKLGEEYDKAKSKNAIVDYNYELIRTYLTSFVGHYRSLERSKRADDFNRMVRSLNDAIKNSNDIK